MSRYLMLAVFIVGMLSYSSKITGQSDSTTIGATVGGVAGAILSSGTPLGLIGGIVVGGFIGNKMDSNTTPNEGVASLRQPKPMNIEG
ncbi:MAG TPA: glycine zipper 2TM domain-containing protein [Methylophilaceae bacterium]|nr:glycine zipper 2TM domain-containing protein [Methylophilaceae bacterium]